MFWPKKTPFTERFFSLCLLHPPCPNTACPHGPELFGKGLGRDWSLKGPAESPAPVPWVPGMCEEPRQLRWRRKAPVFWVQGNGSLSLLLLSILTWLEARTLLPWIPRSSCRTSPASPWLRYLCCAEQSPISSQLVQPRAVPGTALQNMDAWCPLCFSSAQHQDPCSHSQPLRGTSV